MTAWRRFVSRETWRVFSRRQSWRDISVCIGWLMLCFALALFDAQVRGRGSSIGLRMVPCVEPVAQHFDFAMQGIEAFRGTCGQHRS